MDSAVDKNIKRFEIFLLLFISIQPLIDVLTTLSMKVFSQSATFGVFFRFLVMLVSLIYIIIDQRKKRNKIILGYLLSLFAILAINIISNYFVKANFHIIDEIKFLAKIAYAPNMLFTYLLLFKNISDKQNVLNLLKKYIVYALLIIDVVMIVSISTSTSLKAYDYTKIGYSGWFFAGNELGAILAITFPVAIIYAISKTTSAKLSYNWIPVILTGYSLLMLGTKVGYGSLVISLGICLVMCFITWFRKKRGNNRKPYLINGFVSLILLVVLVGITPFSPIFKNTYAHFQLLGINLNSDNTQQATDGKKESSSHKAKHNKKDGLKNINKAQVENLILSSRDVFLNVEKEQFKKAPLIQKAFGMGYGGNYKGQAKMIEMDFYDLFYSLGIVGFLVYILSFIYFIIKVGLNFLRNPSNLLSPIYVLLLCSLVLGLGISYTAGHVITAPAASIYLALVFAFLSLDRTQLNNH